MYQLFDGSTLYQTSEEELIQWDKTFRGQRRRSLTKMLDPLRYPYKQVWFSL